MRFIMRCIFWLSVVYSSILSDLGPRTTASGRDDLAAAARAAIGTPARTMASEAAAGLSAYCQRAPRACLADSAELTALVNASERETAGRDETPTTARRRPAAEPRHRERGAMQARMP